MSVHFLLNLFNELRKRDKMRGLHYMTLPHGVMGWSAGSDCGTVNPV